MAFGTSTEIQAHCGAGSRHRPGKGVDCLEEQELPEAEAAPCAFTKALQGPADLSPHLEAAGGFTGVKGSSLQMELKLLSYEGRLGTSMSPFTMLGGEGILATPSCSHPIFNGIKISFARAAEKPLVSLAAARAGANS